MAKEAHIVPMVEPLLQKARAAGYRIDDELLVDVLRMAGEIK